MGTHIDISIGELFNAKNGRALFIKDYLDANNGIYPVYSASLLKPFGLVDTFDFDGNYLTWVMNGYGGRIQEIKGKFSVNRDRGVLIPRKGVEIPDLTFLRFAIEPQLSAAAVGRRVDGRRNEYTKIYPDAAMEVQISLPATRSGKLDYKRMAEWGARLRRIEAAQQAVKVAREPLLKASFAIEIEGPTVTISLADDKVFSLAIGKRILRSQHRDIGVPTYSANALVPFGRIAKSNLADFRRPSILWGIDGNFDWNLVPAGEEFATTDHCGRLQILSDQIDATYVFWFLEVTKARYGFDRVYRASLENMKAEVTVTFPLHPVSGEICLDRQKAFGMGLQKREAARKLAVSSMDDVLNARIGLDT